MTNSNEQTPEEQRRQLQTELTPAAVTLQTITEMDQRHYAPLLRTLPNESAGYEWRRETGDIQSYRHEQTAGWLHIDLKGQFYDRRAQPLAREQALENAGHPHEHKVSDPALSQSLTKLSNVNDQGLSL